MFGIAATRDRYYLQASGRMSVWTKDYLRKAAVAALGCAIVAVFVAVQLRSGDKVAGTYLALSALWAGLTLLQVDHPQLSGFRLVLKGLLDRCVAATALILLAPLMATPAAASWLSDRGPVLFKQVKGGHAFRICKFRTMVVAAEPRPALPDEAAIYADRVRRRLVVKPGLTRLWQVKWPIGPVLMHGSGAY